MSDEEITFTCAKADCFDAAYGNHAVCKKHFAADFMIVVAFGAALVVLIICFAFFVGDKL